MQKKQDMKNLKRDDVIEIDFGKHLDKVRSNPWILASIVLAIVLLGVILSGGAGGESVSAAEAGQNIVDFVNAQGQGNAFLVSAEKENNLYKIVLNFEGEEVPVYTTLDGKFLISSIIPLENSVVENTDSLDEVQVYADSDDDAVLGDEDAPLTIIEFSDYGCVF